MDWQHIYPLNDLIDHTLVGFECPCNPSIDFNEHLVTHSSMDRRECFEKGCTDVKHE
jgi:hypothetical protein